MGAITSLCCRPEVIDFKGDVNLFHFALLKSVGKGAFGKVRIVRHKETHKEYALKYINKAKCVRMKAVANIVQERRLLEEANHPFIVNLRYAFQDDSNCFFVLDLMLGGDLRFHLERLGSLSEDAVVFFVAEISLALAYLHDQKIIHRDVKPDNILLDAKGHAHLTDFNIAVHYSDSKQLTGVAGSRAYMAPEILHKKGYSYMVDWWSLGVCAFELIFGRRPFRAKTTADLMHAITHDTITFPDDPRHPCSEEGRLLLSDLMTRNPENRLGRRPNNEHYRNYRNHPRFATMDWEKLEKKELTSYLIPDANKSNCDPVYELEEILLEDDHLKARRRKNNRDTEGLSAEMRQMEEQFIIYDFTKMKRRSYFVQDFQILSQTTATTTSMSMAFSTGGNNSRPVTPSALDRVHEDDMHGSEDACDGLPDDRDSNVIHDGPLYDLQKIQEVPVAA